VSATHNRQLQEEEVGSGPQEVQEEGEQAARLAGGFAEAPLH
jgi:hypothetical protein